MEVRVRVKVGARREALKELGKGVLEISVREPAERNAANRRVIELLALHFGVSVKKIQFLKGQRSPAKLFMVLQ